MKGSAVARGGTGGPGPPNNYGEMEKKSINGRVPHIYQLVK